MSSRLIDLNRQPGDFSADIDWIVRIGPDRSVFPMATLATGNELWVTDGSAKGTRMLADIVPGSLGSYPDSPITSGASMMVRITLASGRNQLWITDGTSSGTKFAAEMPEGVDGNLTPLSGNGEGGFFYLREEWSSDDGYGLWFTDGNPEGTRRIEPEDEAGQPLLEYVHQFESLEGICYFTANEGEVWRSDGTVEGTRRIVDMTPYGSGYATSIAISNGRIYGCVSADFSDNHVWSCTMDGGDLVKITPGDAGEWPFIMDMVPTATGLYISAHDLFGMGHLFWSDGSTGGTREITLKDPSDGVIYGPALYAWMEMWQGSLYFSASGDGGGQALWVTDGTEAGTRMLKKTSSAVDAVGPQHIMAAGKHVYFLVLGGDPVWWRTDGTVAGTRRVVRMRGHDPYSYSYLDQATALNGELCFISAPWQASDRLWRTRAQGGGVVQLTKPGRSTATAFMAHSGIEESKPYAEVNGKLLSMVKFGYGLQSELWQIEQRRRKIPGVETKPLWTSPRYQETEQADYWDVAGFRGEVNGKALFTVTTSFTGRHELWGTDGSRRGTRLLHDHSGSRNWLEGFVPSGGVIYYAANVEDDPAASGLWRTDGTQEGTVRIATGMMATQSGGEGMVDFKGFLYFTREQSDGSRALWKTDGRPEGTVLVKDDWGLNPGGGPVNLTVVGDRLAMGVSIPTTGIETLWTSDGTTAGTVQVQMRYTETTVHHVGPGFDLGGIHIFSGRGRTVLHPEEWWRSDGTEAGTYPLLSGLTTPHLPGYVKDASQLGAIAGGKLFYAGYERIDGNDVSELWVMDGTTAGTKKLKEINPGRDGSQPGGFLAVGDVVYFSAYDVAHGSELWRSDGTEAGTVLVADLEPGPLGSAPEDLKVVNGKLYFHAAHPSTGRELHELEIK